MGSDHFSPLLAAYDRRIESLQDALGQKTEVIKELRLRADKIVKDDDTIRKTLEQYMQKCVDLVEDSNSVDKKSETVFTDLVSRETSDLMSSQLKNAKETIGVMVSHSLHCYSLHSSTHTHTHVHAHTTGRTNCHSRKRVRQREKKSKAKRRATRSSINALA